ncbi:RES family NAD+ phosphorylase [Flavisphingomonas formosensis]|uniref:RES family NAD+ phosphorylase n=1 Tax=Flavisphingomonas formosensis TaxID=861534 RepID=UPI0012F8E43F|nr:RES family NAD+ phosphorylase [Sphingomonas formosensis]
MRVSIKIPRPATMKVGKEGYHLLKAGTELHRIHPEAFGSTQFNDTDKGNARFSPIRNKAGAIIPTIYVAQSFECATCEIILRCPDTPPRNRTKVAPPEIVYPNDYRSYAHSHIRTTGVLNLVDITIAGQRKIGVNANALLVGPKSSYQLTRSWAEKIHTECPTAHGLYYGSYQYGPEFALVLFGDRVPDDILEAVSKRAVVDPACHDEIQKLASALSIDYEDV